MPPHSIASAVMTMHTYNCAPWAYERWQEITGVYHGLFPEEDELLPPGWTRKDADNVEYFLDLFQHKNSEVQRIKFVGARKNANAVPGRLFFRTWLSDVWKASQIHATIIDTLSANSLHPVTIALGSGQRSLKKWWPSPRTYSTLALELVGFELFGKEAADDLGFLEHDLRGPTQALITRTWTNVHAQVKRVMVKIDVLEAAAMEALDGM